MRVGVVLDGRRTASEIAELARLAETHGFSHVWLSGGARTKDHFVRLALAAAATRRILLGPVALSPFEMHPVHIGLALLTPDQIAPGPAGGAPGSAPSLRRPGAIRSRSRSATGSCGTSRRPERRPCAWPVGSSAFGSTTFVTWHPRSGSTRPKRESWQGDSPRWSGRCSRGQSP